MTRTRPAATADDAKFPVRLKIKIPATGLGSKAGKAQNWLSEKVGTGRFAIHNTHAVGSDAMAVHLLDVEDAMRFVAAHPELELVGDKPEQRVKRPAVADNIKSAGDYLANACGYALVVKEVMAGPNASDGVVRQSYATPLFLLLGFGTELMLKGAYLLYGGDYDMLSGRGKTIGHSLRQAHMQALGQGFEPIDPDSVTNLVEHLHESHCKYWMRYEMPDEGMALPTAAGCADTIIEESSRLRRAHGIA